VKEPFNSKFGQNLKISVFICLHGLQQILIKLEFGMEEYIMGAL